MFTELVAALLRGVFHGIRETAEDFARAFVIGAGATGGALFVIALFIESI